MWFEGAWQLLYLAGHYEGRPVPWRDVLQRPPDMGLYDACGMWHGYECANDAQVAQASQLDSDVTPAD